MNRSRLLNELKPFLLRWIPREGCRVYRNSDQTIGTASWTALSPNTEVYDNGACWASGNANRFVAPEAGYYCIDANAMFTDGSNTGMRQIAIRNQDGDYLKVQTYAPLGEIGGGFTPMNIFLGNWYLAAAAWLEIVVYQNSGATWLSADARAHRTG